MARPTVVASRRCSGDGTAASGHDASSGEHLARFEMRLDLLSGPPGRPHPPAAAGTSWSPRCGEPGCVALPGRFSTGARTGVPNSTAATNESPPTAVDLAGRRQRREVKAKYAEDAEGVAERSRCTGRSTPPRRRAHLAPGHVGPAEQGRHLTGRRRRACTARRRVFQAARGRQRLRPGSHGVSKRSAASRGRPVASASSQLKKSSAPVLLGSRLPVPAGQHVGRLPRRRVPGPRARRRPARRRRGPPAPSASSA